MELLLTSFGLSPEYSTERRMRELFYRMPPVMMSEVGESFFPDYAVLLLCDKIVVDSRTYEQLRGETSGIYRQVAETIRVLHDEGFVRLEDFESIVREQASLLEEMLERDMRHVDDWVNPLKESQATWQDFIQKAIHAVEKKRVADRTIEEGEGSNISEIYPHAISMLTRNISHNLAAYHENMHFFTHGRHIIGNITAGPHPSYYDALFQEALKSSRKRRKPEFRAVLKSYMSEYLSYVNANLVISNVLGIGIHDWYDFIPFYREKMLTVGRRRTREEQRISKVNELFDISFPDFRIMDTRSLVKALRDKRISDLRQLVDEAVEGRVEFDSDFARRILIEVYKQERQLQRFQKIVSYVTIPLDFIPWVGTLVQKGAEEAAIHFKEKKLKRKYKWFYLISELSR